MPRIQGRFLMFKSWVTPQPQDFLSPNRYWEASFFFAGGSIVYSHSSHSLERNWKIRLRKTNTELSPGPWRNGKQVLGSLVPDWTIYTYIPAGVVLTEKLHSKICQPRGAKTPHRLVLFSNRSRNILCPSPSRPQTKVLGGSFTAGPAPAIASFYPQEASVLHYDLLPKTDKALPSSLIKSPRHSLEPGKG